MARTDTPSSAPSPFRHTLRVYWEDTDAGGVVFYANYLKFFERARTEWLRALGFSQERLRTDTGVLFVVADTAVRYASPARLDDLIEVSVEPRDIGRATMSLHQQAWRTGHTEHGGPLLLAEGHIRIGCVDAGTFAPRRIPTAILQALK
ncbi:tol-pal system-associated acyl-CoA thioesterase [Piscinibacter sp.]|uniref:tol-pal system-associated acyl-CoA thioesterase n=1 Tax=Piscinibacter sp. TaxID=1903157 RepID=UPI0037833AA9